MDELDSQNSDDESVTRYRINGLELRFLCNQNITHSYNSTSIVSTSM